MQKHSSDDGVELQASMSSGLNLRQKVLSAKQNQDKCSTEYTLTLLERKSDVIKANFPSKNNSLSTLSILLEIVEIEYEILKEMKVYSA